MIKKNYLIFINKNFKMKNKNYIKILNKIMMELIMNYNS